MRRFLVTSLCALPVWRLWRDISDIEKDDNWDDHCKYCASKFLVNFILTTIFFFRIPKDRYCNRHWIRHHGFHRIFRQTHPYSHQQHHCGIVDFLFVISFFVSFFFQAVRMIQLPTFVLQHPMYTNFMNVQPLRSCYPKTKK